MDQTAINGSFQWFIDWMTTDPAMAIAPRVQKIRTGRRNTCSVDAMAPVTIQLTDLIDARASRLLPAPKAPNRCMNVLDTALRFCALSWDFNRLTWFLRDLPAGRSTTSPITQSSVISNSESVRPLSRYLRSQSGRFPLPPHVLKGLLGSLYRALPFGGLSPIDTNSIPVASTAGCSSVTFFCSSCSGPFFLDMSANTLTIAINLRNCNFKD